MQADKLLNELIQCTQSNMREVQKFTELSDEVLNAKATNESWSILECIEHLNRYGDFYIPEITKQLNTSRFKVSKQFKTGLLGNYFAKSMMPKEKLNTMKTFKEMNPANSLLSRKVLDKFLTQQEQILALLHKAKQSNLTKIKTAISISKWIKLRLGDTFRVVIYHNLRHIIQAKKCLN